MILTYFKATITVNAAADSNTTIDGASSNSSVETEPTAVKHLVFIHVRYAGVKDKATAEKHEF